MHARAVGGGVAEKTASNTRPMVRQAFAVGRPTKTRTLTFRLTTADADRLEQLRMRTGARTTSELLLRALGAYDLLVDYLGRGYELVLEPSSALCSKEESQEVEEEISRLLGSGVKRES